MGGAGAREGKRSPRPPRKPGRPESNARPPDRRAGRRRSLPSGPALSFARTTLAAAVAIGFAVSVVAWAGRWPAMSPGGDNAAYLSLAGSLAFDGRYAETWTPDSPPHAKYPPVYPAVLAAMMLAGAESWGAFKASSALFVGLAAAFAFLWARRREGLAVSVAAALLFGLSPAARDTARWVLADPLFVALTMASLWALTAPRRSPASAGAGAGPPPARESAASLSAGFLSVGLALAGLAYFTRSAGLPLAATAAIGLAATRRWRALAAFAACFLPLAALWASRGGGAGYASEFWLKDPYAPDLGTLGAADFLERVAVNVVDYATIYVPAWLAGWRGGWAVAGGLGLAALVVAGWIRQVRRGAGPAEIFLPAYAAVLAVWPTMWASPRFVLPLFPIIVLHAAEGLRMLAARVRVQAVYVLAAGTLAMGVPIAPAVPRALRATAAITPLCNSATVPAACDNTPTSALAVLGLWAADQLPADAVVLARKPRLFHLFSGLPAVTVPFSRNEGALFALADSVGARYVVLTPGELESATFAAPVRSSPGRFCTRFAVTLDAASGGAGVLEILDPEAADPEAAAGPRPCAGELGRVPEPGRLRSMTVPVVTRARARAAP